VIRTIDSKLADRSAPDRGNKSQSSNYDSTENSSMAIKVSLVNVGKDLWTYLCRHTPPPLAISNIANEKHLTDILHDGHIDCSLIVLGHHMQEPLRIASWIQEHDPHIKIFLLRKPADFEALSLDIKDTPNLVNSIEIWSTADIKALPGALKEAAERTNETEEDHFSIEEIELKGVAEDSDSLQTSDHRLDSILEAASIGLLCIDEEDTILELNPLAALMLDLDENDSLGTPLSLVFRQSEIIKLHHIINTADDDEEILPNEITFVGELGNVKHYRVSAFADEENHKYVINLVLQDVTQSATAETKLAQEKQRNHITLKLLKDGVITTDSNCNIETMNPVAEGLTGWPSYEAKNTTLDTVFKLIDATTRERIINLGSECIGTGKAIETNSNLILLDRFNNEHPIELSITPSSSLNIETGGLVLIFKDATETRRLTQEISHQASHDALTGLLNRQEFEFRLQKAIDSAAAHDVQHVLCYLDLNQFKDTQLEI